MPEKKDPEEHSIAVSISLPPDLHERVNARMATTRLGRSVIVQDALREYFDRLDTQGNGSTGRRRSSRRGGLRDVSKVKDQESLGDIERALESPDFRRGLAKAIRTWREPNHCAEDQGAEAPMLQRVVHQ